VAENKEEKGQEDGGEAKKGKLLPILLGVILVVGAAVGTVAFVMPAGEPGKVEVPAWGEPIVYATLGPCPGPNGRDVGWELSHSSSRSGLGRAFSTSRRSSRTKCE
jgi:hypothetical protein